MKALQKPQSKPKAHFASRNEAAEAIRGLSRVDKVKLLVIARYFWRNRIQGALNWQDPEDLLQEAVVRTLEGRRQWRKSVYIVKHLDRTMESISGHLVEARKDERQHSTSESIERIDPSERDDVIRRSVSSTAKDETTARALLVMIEAMFEEDPEAIQVLRCRGAGCSPSATCQRLGISKRRYEAVNKRIRRRLVKNESIGNRR